LLTFRNINRLDRVRQPDFFQKDCDFMSVRRRPVIEIDHVIYPRRFLSNYTVRAERVNKISLPAFFHVQVGSSRLLARR
jgi:hypothetical protein